MTLLKTLQKVLPDEYDEVKRDPVFAQILTIHENCLGYSGRLIHSFMCKQLDTAKVHELWFVFARRPLRFSLQEFYAVTGLKYKGDDNCDFEQWKDDMGFWSKLLKRGGNISIKTIKDEHIKVVNKWKRVDRLRLVYLCVIAGLLMAKDEKVNISHTYIKLVMDIGKLRTYPWGLHAFDLLVKSIIKTREKLKQKKSYVLDGISYAFQILFRTLGLCWAENSVRIS